MTHEQEYRVVVGNVGTVHTGDNFGDAQREYLDYCELAKSGYGRVSGEPVTLLEDGEPIAPDNDLGFIRRIVSIPGMEHFICAANDTIQNWNPYNRYAPDKVASTSYSDYTHPSTMQGIEFEPIEELYIIPELLTYGDYCNTGFIGRANVQAFTEEYGKHFDTFNIHNVSGGYGSESIAIPVSLLVETGCNLCGDDNPCELCNVATAIRETLDALEDYPCIDDELVSELEMEDWDEQYADWGRSDFIGELEKRFPEYELDELEEVGEQAIDKLFYQLCEDTSTYPEQDGNSMYIRIEDVCREVSRVDVSAIPGVVFEPDNVDELGDTLRKEREAYIKGYMYAIIRTFTPNKAYASMVMQGDCNLFEPKGYRKEIGYGDRHNTEREAGWSYMAYRIEFPLPNHGTPMLPGFELTETPINLTHMKKVYDRPETLCGVANPVRVELHDRTKVSCPQCRAMMRERN